MNAFRRRYKHMIKCYFLINNLMSIKGRDWDRGRTGRCAEMYLKQFEDKQNKDGRKQ
jgi:hypothetical protein